MGDQRSRSRPDLRRNDRFCVFPKREKRAENPFFAIAIAIAIARKGYFFLLTTPPGHGRNMVRTEKCIFFGGPKIPDFGPKIRFLIWDPDFCQRGVCSPRRWLRLGVGPVQIARFVAELRPFSSGSARFAPKSLDQSHYGDTVCQ